MTSLLSFDLCNQIIVIDITNIYLDWCVNQFREIAQSGQTNFQLETQIAQHILI